MAVRLTAATIPAKARDSKWSPTPTASHEDFCKAQRSGHRHLGMPVLRVAQAALAAIGRQWALLVQGFFADG
jgi:hypothetical protein